MNLKIGFYYKIVIKVESVILTYTAKILSFDDSFISFQDKFDKVYSYNKNNIISYTEIGESLND